MFKDKIKKVDYSEYKDKFDMNICQRMETEPQNIDVETMRAWLYGFTFTEEYAEEDFPDEMSMDYWNEKFENTSSPDDASSDACVPGHKQNSQQANLLLMAINSTGDGKTPETALAVIDVSQEYEYIRNTFPYSLLKVKRQRYRNGIDCLEFEPNDYHIERIYFDISRRFAIGY